MTNQHWMGVVCRTHVERGVAGGFAQLCHGKARPLRLMHAGDWLVYYSPSSEMRGGQRLQAFTALGQVIDDDVYQVDMGGGFTPFRRNVRYQSVRAVAIADLADRLHLTARVNWGMALRFGHLALDEHDFALIAEEMRGGASQAIAADFQRPAPIPAMTPQLSHLSAFSDLSDLGSR
jgi:hypothetical protein